MAAVPMDLFTFPNKPADHAGQLYTDDIEIQLIPDFLQGSTQTKLCVQLEAGKAAPLDVRLDEVHLNFDWTFKPELPGFDVDSSMALLKLDGSVHDFVWWDNRKTKCECVKFLSADDLRGDQAGTKESIQVQLQKIPDSIFYMVVAVSVYSKDHNLQHLQDVTLAIDGPDKAHLVQYKVELKHTVLRSLLLGCFVRKGEGWEFQAMDDSVPSRTVSEIMHEPENLAAIRNIQPTPRIRRRVTLQPTEGKNLTPMDFSLLRKRSDPYLKIFHDDKVEISEVTYATLNPKIVCGVVYLGEVPDSSTKVVEIQCWDYDKFTDHDSMGVIKFCLGGLMSKVVAGENKVWFQLLPTSQHKEEKTKITGHILCKVMVEEFV